MDYTGLLKEPRYLYLRRPAKTYYKSFDQVRMTKRIGDSKRINLTDIFSCNGKKRPPWDCPCQTIPSDCDQQIEYNEESCGCCCDGLTSQKTDKSNKPVVTAACRKWPISTPKEKPYTDAWEKEQRKIYKEETWFKDPIVQDDWLDYVEDLAVTIEEHQNPKPEAPYDCKKLRAFQGTRTHMNPNSPPRRSCSFGLVGPKPSWQLYNEEQRMIASGYYCGCKGEAVPLNTKLNKNLSAEE